MPEHASHEKFAARMVSSGVASFGPFFSNDSHVLNFWEICTFSQSIWSLYSRRYELLASRIFSRGHLELI
eukprot:gene627-223_t